jgi:hypothetical protein
MHQRSVQVPIEREHVQRTEPHVREVALLDVPLELEQFVYDDLLALVHPELVLIEVVRVGAHQGKARHRAFRARSSVGLPTGVAPPPRARLGAMRGLKAFLRAA